MNEEDLRIFETVAAERSVTRAAQLLRRVPSNITVRIQGMERELNTALFVREKNRLALSPDGRTYLRYATEIRRLHGEARMALKPGEPIGELALGSMDSVAATRLPSILTEFHRRHPRASVQLVTGTTGALLDRLAAGELEAAMVADAPKNESFESCLASREELVLVAPADHAAIRSPKDVRFHTCFTFSRGCAYRARLERWLAAKEVTPARISELSSYHAILGCIAAGMGVAFIPRIVLDHFPAREAVSLHPLPKPFAQVDISFVWRKSTASSRVRGMETVIRSTANKAVDHRRDRRATTVSPFSASETPRYQVHKPVPAEGRSKPRT